MNRLSLKNKRLEFRKSTDHLEEFEEYNLRLLYTNPERCQHVAGWTWQRILPRHYSCANFWSCWRESRANASPWTDWVWGISGWSSGELQIIQRNLKNIASDYYRQIPKDVNISPVGLGNGICPDTIHVQNSFQIEVVGGESRANASPRGHN